MNKRLGLYLALFLGLTGCASNLVTVNKTYDHSKIKRVAVLGFEAYEGIPSSGRTMTGVFEKWLMTAGYRLIEREQVDKVLKEQNFQLAGGVDKDQAVKLGKILGVDALVMGSVVVYSQDQSSIVMVNIRSVTQEPVIVKKDVQIVRNGKTVIEQVDSVVDYRVTHHNEKQPQVYRIQAQSGVVAKMVDTESGELIWVGSDTAEGVNVQDASEYVVRRIVKALKTIWPINLAKAN